MGSEEQHRLTADRILSSSVLLVASRFSVQVVSAVATAVVARSISVEDFGNLNGGLAIFYLATALCDWGFGLSLARRLGRGSSRDGSVVRSVARLQNAWSGFVTVLVVAYAAISGWSEPRMRVLLILTPAIAATGVSVYRQVLIANDKTKLIVLPGLLINFASAMTTVALALWGFGISALSIVVSVAAVLSSLVLLYLGRKQISAIKGTARLRRSIRREVVPLGLQSFLSSAYFTIDVVILSYFVSSSELGHYTAAVKILSFVILIPGIIAQVSVVGFSSIHQDRMSTLDLQTQSWKWLSFGFLPVVVLLGLYAPIFVTAYFGGRFGSIIPIVRILMIAGVIVAVSNTIFGAMIARSRQRWLVGQGLLCLVFNVSANVFLIPVFGITASAWISLATEILVAVGMSIALARMGLFPLYLLRAWKYYVAILVTAIPPWVLWGGRSLTGLFASASAIAVSYLILRLVPQELVDVLRRRSSNPVTRS
jgi:O-antigen/teichoic acid export membrane protein